MSNSKLNVIGEINIPITMVLEEEVKGWCGIISDKMKEYKFNPNCEVLGTWLCALVNQGDLHLQDGWVLPKIEHFLQADKHFAFRENVLLLGTAESGKSLGLIKEKRIYSPCIIFDEEKQLKILRFHSLHKVTDFKILIVKKID